MKSKRPTVLTISASFLFIAASIVWAQQPNTPLPDPGLEPINEQVDENVQSSTAQATSRTGSQENSSSQPATETTVNNASPATATATSNRAQASNEANRDNRWRYRRHNGEWWYWHPNEYWLIHRNNAWTRFERNAYRRTPSRSYNRTQLYGTQPYNPGPATYGNRGRVYTGYRGVMPDNSYRVDAYGRPYANGPNTYQRYPYNGRGYYNNRPYYYNNPVGRAGANVGQAVGDAIGGQRGAAVGEIIGGAIGSDR